MKNSFENFDFEHFSLNVHTKGDDWFEIPQSCIREVGREIGKGAFGRVFIGRISDVPGKIGSQIVAIKRLKSKFMVNSVLKESVKV